MSHDDNARSAGNRDAQAREASKGLAQKQLVHLLSNG